MQAINPRFLQARRRAAHFTAPHLAVPTAERRSLTPRVQIGILRDPADPIHIFPAIHCPETRRPDRYDAVAVLAVAGLAALLYWI